MSAPLAPAHTLADLGELALVERITSRLARPAWAVVGVGDDAAVLEQAPRTLEVLTTDALVEGVHFDRRFVPPDAVGHRALAVNLSDLAAMGARPRAALLSLILPSTLEVAFVDGLLDGLLALADAHRIAVVGGNVSRSPGPIIVDVTATGVVKRRRVLERRGARVGDDVYVTGTLGAAAVGLRALQQSSGHPQSPAGGDVPHVPDCEARFLRPIPRTRAGYLLGEQKVATSCIDLSDGLADGLHRLAEASRVGIAVDASALPVSEGVRQWCAGDSAGLERLVLSGGDDYELLFTCGPRSRGRLRGVQRLLGDLPITRIGVVTRPGAVVMRGPGGEQPVPRGFAHFG